MIKTERECISGYAKIGKVIEPSIEREGRRREIESTEMFR